ncbi:MAG: thioredoxin fold domain-containing protein [Pseudomonadota bacterium]
MAAFPSHSPARAAVDPTIQTAPKNQTELVVVETLDCAYCRSFRQNLLPAYAASRRAKETPIRFINYKEVRKSGISLKQPISIVPTILVLDDGREIGRIPGLTGQELFFKSIQHILGRP